MRLSFRKTNGGMAAPPSVTSSEGARDFVQGLGVFDATLLVVGIMIGSGILIVSADMARQIGGPGGWLLAWGIAGLLTLAGALFYGEWAAMMPWAGGQYVFLREACSPLWGFLYGWTLFLVIQTGMIAVVSVAFVRFLGVLWSVIAEDRCLIPPGHLSEGWALLVQGLWAAALVLLRTFHPETGTYGNLYSNLLDYVISAALLFYILTILGIFRLRAKWPDRERPYRVWGYPIVPALYIVGAGTTLAVLLHHRTATTWLGFILVLAGVPVYGLLRYIRARIGA